MNRARPVARCFRFSYHMSDQPKGRTRPHLLRDADGFAQLSALLLPAGFEYGGLLLNYPGRSIQPSQLTPSDLLVLTTRPPLDDLLADVHKQSKSTDSPLERRVFAALRPYFDVCARSQLVLAEPVAERLTDGFADRAVIEFRVHGDPAYKALKTHRDDLRFHRPLRDDLTAAFLIRTPPIWDGGPSLLAAFAMSGTVALVWTHILRTRLPGLVRSSRPRFVMAEIMLAGVPVDPVDLTFADRLAVELIVDAPLPLRFERNRRSPQR